MSDITALVSGAIVVIGVLSIAGLTVGSRIGARVRTNGLAAGGALGAALLVTVVLLLVTRGPAERIGPVVRWITLLLAGAADIGLIGGVAIGQARKGGQFYRARALASVLVVLLVADLAGASVLCVRVARVARELGLTRAVAAYRPEKNQTCRENLTRLYAAFSLYAQDWDALPPAAGWLANDDLVSKVRENEWLHCPAVSNRHDNRYGYAYNTQAAGRSLRGKPLPQMPNAARIPLLYDSSNLAMGAYDAFTSLPRPGRHDGLDNVLYCDGHVAAVAPR